MAIKRTDFIPHTGLTADQLEEVQDNGAIQVSTITELATLPSTVKVAYCLENSLIYYYYGTAWVPASNPTGSLAPFAGSAAPTGWVLCYGQELAIASYGALYAVVSTTYGALTNGSGGAGSTHFRVPDLRGRTIAALDNMGGSDAGRLTWDNTLGTASGTQTHTLTSGESGLPAHGHTASSGNDSPDHTHQLITEGGTQIYRLGGSTGGGWSPSVHSGGASARHTHAITVNNNTAADASAAHNNMQPTILLNYIIKT